MGERPDTILNPSHGDVKITGVTSGKIEEGCPRPQGKKRLLRGSFRTRKEGPSGDRGRGDRHRRQNRDGRTRSVRAAFQWASADRRYSRRRQDNAGEGASAGAGTDVQTNSVYP